VRLTVERGQAEAEQGEAEKPASRHVHEVNSCAGVCPVNQTPRCNGRVRYHLVRKMSELADSYQLIAVS
jgi:hypothetical protein